MRAEGHGAVGAQVLEKIGLAHRALEGREEEREGLLVVPDVGAVHGAAAAVVAAALEGEELLASRGACRCSCGGWTPGSTRRRGPWAGRVLVKKASWKERERRLEALQVLHRVSRHVPGVREASGVVVAQELALHLGLAVPVVLAQREVPGEHERDRWRIGRARGAGGGPGSRRPSACPRWAPWAAAAAKRPFGRELVDPVLEGIEPLAALPGGERRRGLVRGDEGHGAVSRALVPVLGRGHVEADDPPRRRSTRRAAC